MKIKWRVGSRPTGRYRSFEMRSWPSAEYEDGRYCASILCDDEYVPKLAKSGNHKPLKLRLAKYSESGSWTPVFSKKEFKTLKEAKEAVPGIIIRNKLNHC